MNRLAAYVEMRRHQRLSTQARFLAENSSDRQRLKGLLFLQRKHAELALCCLELWKLCDN